ncbi:MAG: hypothetical protein EAX96_12370 [Candidatus Lokiarchaeota archaeon]|nr:hypothetical protein [Candidatus Lokiarchaeota archaeon]
MERRKIRKEKQKELEKKKADLKKTGKNKSVSDKSSYFSKKYAFLLIAIVILAIVIPILVIFLTPTTASSVFTESDNIYYTYENNILSADFISCKYGFAVTGAVIDAGIKDEFDFDIIHSNITRTYTGDLIQIVNSTLGKEIDYSIGGIPNIDFNIIKISDGLMNYPCSVWWNHNLTNTTLDSQKTDLNNYITNLHLDTSINSLTTNLNSTQDLNVKFSISGGNSLTGFNKIDMLKLSFSFKNQENITFTRPLPINSSLFINNDEITFCKVAYDIKANQEIIFEFNLTINCKNNFTNLNLINPIQNSQIFIQFKNKLINDIYSHYSTLGEASLERINDLSNKAKEAWNNLDRIKYLNLLIKVPLIYNSSIYI